MQRDRRQEVARPPAMHDLPEFARPQTPVGACRTHFYKPYVSHGAVNQPLSSRTGSLRARRRGVNINGYQTYAGGCQPPRRNTNCCNEETRIVVISGNRLDEFDYEAANRRQLRGNIYLAKVTRVEPSLQAAFVEYGGNRHGFLAFSEIHPDYFQIPVADREALLADVARSVAHKADEETTEGEKPSNGNMPGSGEQPLITDLEAKPADDADMEPSPESKTDTGSDDEEQGETEKDQNEDHDGDDDHDDYDDQNFIEVPDDDDDDELDDETETNGEELIERRRSLARRYKIQEVIKRRQVLLVQVVKEERGNKGAALTTYLSLAGRYSVLMPNTARGGGISRKITASADRKRLKQIAGELRVPTGMGVILRTAGAARTKAEIKRDFEYLSRLWENVRQLTMKSMAPCLVYEEGSLIKRTIRDLYHKDISEVLVAGNQAYREAKDFMRLIMPSHAKNVKAYKENQNLFSRFNVETQLDSMFSPKVVLPSGGYLVINPTEALISIDVNSGRATREHNIEDTALQTNLEAAEEVARQLRLRDLAGLIVIDFIDMTERRSIRNVEKRMKDALKNERARIQIGRISNFGLMEMSRQRMRFGVLESTTQACPMCEGTGIVRAVQSLALMVMRAIEDHVAKRPGNSIQVRTPREVALYILNGKRELLVELEERNNLTITITADSKLTNSQFTIERGEDRIMRGGSGRPAVGVSSAAVNEVEEAQESKTETETESKTETETESKTETENKPQRNRRRRKSANGQNQNNAASRQTTEPTSLNEPSSTEETGATHPDANAEDQPRKRRRRGRRGGRRNRRNQNPETQNPETQEQNNEQQSANPEQTRPLDAENAGADAPAPVTSTTEAPEGMNEADNSSVQTVSEAGQTPAETGASAETTKDKPAKKPARRRTRRAKKPQDEGKAGASPASVADNAPAPAIGAPEPARQESESAPDIAPPQAGAQTTEQENESGQPARKLPKEGIIVSTSSGEVKPKRKGWWSRG